MNELEQNINTYFGIIRQDELKSVSSYFKENQVEKGELFLKAGQKCQKLSFIKSGLFRIYAISGDKEVTQWISTPGYFVTDLASLYFNTPARWTIQAMTDAEIYTITKNDYVNLGKLIPKWHELEKIFIAKCFTILEDRIFSHLSMTAEERYQSFYNNNRELFNQVPLQYIASMLGMTPETFSRIRKKSSGNLKG